MILTYRFLAPCCAVMLAVPVQAQQTAPATPDAPAVSASVESFPFEIGHAARSGSVFTVTATQPITSKLTGQKMCLKIVDTTGTNTTTRYYTLATGKHKTVAQLTTTVSDILQRFLSVPLPTAPGQELGKIGDVQHGGEVHFVADPSDRLRLDSLHPTEPAHASFYSRAEVEAWQAALTGKPMP